MPIEIQPRIEDTDLKILAELSNAELEVLYKIIVGKGKLTESLSSNKIVKRYYPDHERYVDLLAKELIAFGSHTFFFKKNYAAIVRDVCDKMEVAHGDLQTIERLEQDLLSKVLERSWESMSDDDRRDLLDSIGEKNTSLSGMTFDVLNRLFQAGGSPSKMLTMSIVGSIGESILGNTFASIVASTGGALLLESATEFAATRAASILTGPIGIGLATIFTLKQLGGPAYRVTVPAVIYIAGLRRLHASKPGANSSMKNSLIKNPSTRHSPLNLTRRKRVGELPDIMFAGFGWKVSGNFDVDAVAFLLRADGRVDSDAEFVFFNQPIHPSGGVEWIENVPRGFEEVEMMQFDLSRLPSTVRSIKLFLTIDAENFEPVSDIFIKLVDGTRGQEIFRSRLKGDFTRAKTIELGELVRQGGGWEFEFTGNGSDSELAALCKEFGVNAE